MRRLLGTGLVVALLACSAVAQGLFGERTGELFVVESLTNEVYRVAGTGPSSSVTSVGLSAARIRPITGGSYIYVGSRSGYPETAGFIGRYGPPKQRLAGTVVDARMRSFEEGGNYLVGGVSYFILDDSPAIWMTDLDGNDTTLHSGSPLQMPTALVADAFGNMWIGDAGAKAIFKLTTSGNLSTFATGLWCDSPADLALDEHGNLIVANNGALDGVFRVNRFGGMTTVQIGSPIVTPSGICVLSNGDYVVTDGGSGNVFSVTPAGVVATLVSGFVSPSSPMEIEPMDGAWLADRASLGRVWGGNPHSNFLQILSGGPWSNDAPDALIQDRRHEFVMAANDSVFALTAQGKMTTLHLGFPLSNLNDIVVEAGGGYLLAGTVGGNGVIWRMDATGVLSTFYNGAQQHAGAVASCEALAFGKFGEILISDSADDSIWRLSPDASTLTTFFSGAPLSSPHSIAWHRTGLCVANGDNKVYVIDQNQSASSIYDAGTTIEVLTGHPNGEVSFTASTIVNAPGMVVYLSDGSLTFRSIASGTPTDLTDSSAWFQEGDIVFTTADGPIFRQHRWGLSSFSMMVPNQVATAIIPGQGFQEFAATVRDGGNAHSCILLLRKDGHVPLHVGPPLESPTDLARDENGGYAVTDNGATKALYRFAPDGSIATLHSGAPFIDPASVTIDLDNGDYIVADAAASALFRVTRSGQLTTVATGLGVVRSVVQDVRSGYFYTGGFGSIQRVTRGGVVTTIATGLDFVTDLVMTSEYELLTVEVGVPTGGGLRKYDVNGNQIGQSLSEYDDSPWSAAIAYNEKLKGMGNGDVGQAYEMAIDAPGDAGFAYSVLASLTLRPGLPLQGRTLAIMPDGLTAIVPSLPTIFRRFNGTLDDNGHATPSVAVPNDANLIGLRIFLSGFTTEVGYGNDGIRTVFNTIGMTIR